MRDGIFAMYKGTEYEAGASDDDSFTLRSHNIKDVIKGFSPYKGVVYVKDVNRSELDEIWRIRTYAEYKNYKFGVRKEDGDKILLSGTVGDYRFFESLGMDLVDQGVYQKWVNKSDIASIYEEKTPI
jgi:hypothetical protein